MNAPHESPVFAMRGIVKRFGKTAALTDVDLTLKPGRVHALVGENGAGKSTLIKILTGAYPPDTGTMAIEGRAVRFGSPREAQACGIAAVHQEINLLWFCTVAENLLLGREPLRFG